MFRSFVFFAKKATNTSLTQSGTPVKRVNTNNVLVTPFPLTPELSKFMNAKEASPSEITKFVWQYAKNNNLQDGRTINCDTTLAGVLGSEKLEFGSISKAIFEHRRRMVPPAPKKKTSTSSTTTPPESPTSNHS